MESIATLLPSHPIPHHRCYATFSAVLTLCPGDPQRTTRRSGDETIRRHRSRQSCDRRLKGVRRAGQGAF